MNLLESLFIHYLAVHQFPEPAFQNARSTYEFFQEKSKAVLPAPEPERPRVGGLNWIESTSASAIPPTAIEEEIRWRTIKTWEAHLAENHAFYLAENGKPPSVAPTMTPEIRKDIRNCLKTYDSHLLTPDKRELWLRESKTRASGIGLFLDPFLTGKSPDNDVNAKGKRFLESWRPWRHQRGKPEKTEELAQLYFEARDVNS